MEKIKNISKPELSTNEIAFAIGDWSHGKLETAIDLYEKYGLDIFRKMPEKYWKIKGDKIVLYRALSPEEIKSGPVMFGGLDNKKRIQRLTAWSWDKKSAEQWKSEGNKVISMEAEQADIAFAPLNLSKHNITEKEVVVADYHLKKGKIKEE
jgi:hypothetical protein